jgi:hypothetical protein
MSMTIVEGKTSTVGRTEEGRPHHCTFMRRAGEVNIHFTGRINIKMKNDDGYIETTVEELEALIALHKKKQNISSID